LIEESDRKKYESAAWLEKRHEWNAALEGYSEKLAEDPTRLEYQKGKLRCLKNLYDWDNLSSLVGQMWDQELKKKAKAGSNKINFSDDLLQIA